MKTAACAIFAAFLAAAAATPAAADEIEDALKLALEAYQAGDINGAKEEVEFASALLSQLKAEGLSAYLPPALPGWTRQDGGDQSAGMAAFGGGMAVSATYTRDQDRIEVQLMAGGQMVTSMAAMFGNAAMMSSMGTVKRINREKVVISQSGDVQALIDNRIFVQISGRAPEADKEAYFAALDTRALEDF